MIKYSEIILGLGLVILLAVAAFMLLVTLDLRYSFLIGVTLLFFAGYLFPRNTIRVVLKAALLSASLIAGYFFLIVAELPGQWISIPLFYLSASAGFYAKHTISPTLKLVLSSCLLATSLLYSFLIIPLQVNNDLTEIKEEPAESFVLWSMTENRRVTEKDWKGKIVILDFFGTWCRPCIAEMKEIQPIYSEWLKNNVEFVVVCTDQGGDSVEKVERFMSRHKFPFKTYYDSAGVTHKKFKFTGVPGLVILDAAGNVRLKHEGYNSSENIVKSIEEFIAGLKTESINGKE